VLLLLSREWLVCIRAPLGSIQEDNRSPLGVLHFRAGGNCSSERRFGGSVSVRDAEVKRKMKDCVAPYMCIGTGSKKALSR
jgi:hypothetical protein